MKRKSYLVCLVMLIVFTTLGCSKKQEIVIEPKEVKQEVEVVEVKRLNQLEDDSIVSFTDSIDIKAFNDAVKTAVKVPGITEMSHPPYKITVDKEPYFLWIFNGKGILMKTKDTHTSYNLQEDSTRALENIFKKAFPAIKEDGTLDIASYTDFPMDSNNVASYIGAFNPTPIEEVKNGVYVMGVQAHGNRQFFQIFSKVSEGEYQSAKVRLDGENLMIEITSHNANSGEDSHPYVIHGLSVKEMPRYYVVVRNGKTEKKEEIAYGIE